MKLFMSLAVFLVAAFAVSQDYRIPIAGDDYHKLIVGTINYVDTGIGLQDWHCGTSTYPNHHGTDLLAKTWSEDIDIVAAENGYVYWTETEHKDTCASFTETGCGRGYGEGNLGNQVRIIHTDGRISFYGHMKKYSLVVSCGIEINSPT